MEPICLRILRLLSLLMFAIFTIVNLSTLISNGLFAIVVLNCRTCQSEMSLNFFPMFRFRLSAQTSSLFDGVSSAYLKFVV